ncbi:hypothetical protein GQ457_17G005950 [Hibiscus cannabinus]
MVSPQSEEVSKFSARVLGVGSTVESSDGVANGRPPDPGRQAVLPSRLERSATPVNAEDQQVVKRSRGEGDEVMDIGVEAILGKQVDGVMQSDEGVVNQGTTVHTNPSFRDMLMGGLSDGHKASSIPDLDVDIQEEDVKFSMVNGTPAICFSDRLHALVDAKLEHSVIIRLLGRSIGYNALLNRIRSLWNPRGEVALIDLENGYLTVQPWSRDFSTELDHSDKIVVWARLPGLPYRYYTKSMFRYIAGVIGQIVRIDYNTEKGKRGRFARLAIVVDLNKPLVPGILVDGVFQKVEYEGLPMICYSCGRYGHTYDSCQRVMEEANAKRQGDMSEKKSALPKERFGPWMQVSNRRAQKVPRNNSIVNSERMDRGKAKVVESRFAVLASDVNEIELQDEELRLGDHGVGDIPSVEDVVGEGLGDNSDVQEDSVVARKVGGEENRVVLRGSGSEMLGVGSNKMSTKDEQRVKVNVAAMDVVIQEPVTLNADAQTAVRIVERGADLVHKKGVGRRSTSGLTEVAVKGIPRVGGARGGGRAGNQIRIKQITRQPGRVGLDYWVGNMDRELEESGRSDERPPVGDVDQTLIASTEVHWRENGADFNRFLRLFLSSHNPDVLVLMEPRCFVSIDVLAVSSQYIHASCLDVDAKKRFFITCVYASPNRRNQDVLWGQLLALRPGANVAWVLGGDFNSILNVTEHMGGSSRRDGVSSKFGDFIREANLNDLGFQGPRYTWKHGSLHQRLDRCIGNDEWWNMWPSSQVMHLSRLGSDHRLILLVTEPSVAPPRRTSFKYLAAWQHHGGFEEMLAANWRLDEQIVDNIAQFHTAARKWNHDSFGHISRRKFSLLARIRGIERVNETSAVPVISDLEECLKRDLDEVLRQEESLWLQRSRSEWIADGDRNTKYYHRITKANYRRKMCHMIKLEHNQWCQDPTLIREGVFRLPDCSDHSHGYLVLKAPLIKPPKPFKFFNFWADHPEFITIVEDSWKQPVSGNPLHVLFVKLKRLKEPLRKLNKEQFSDISNRVLAKHVEFENVQRMIVTNPSPMVVGQEKRVAAELLDLYKVEENFLMQKSKVQFIKEGDQNSSFFFRQVAVRQRANSIRVLQDSQDSNLDTFESISGELVRFFSSSLGVVDDNVESVSDYLLKELLGVELTAEMKNSLIAPVTK